MRARRLPVPRRVDTALVACHVAAAGVERARNALRAAVCPSHRGDGRGRHDVQHNREVRRLWQRDEGNAHVVWAGVGSGYVCPRAWLVPTPAPLRFCRARHGQSICRGAQGSRRVVPCGREFCLHARPTPPLCDGVGPKARPPGEPRARAAAGWWERLRCTRCASPSSTAARCARLLAAFSHTVPPDAHSTVCASAHRSERCVCHVVCRISHRSASMRVSWARSSPTAPTAPSACRLRKMIKLWAFLHLWRARDANA